MLLLSFAEQSLYELCIRQRERRVQTYQVARRFDRSIMSVVALILSCDIPGDSF